MCLFHDNVIHANIPRKIPQQKVARRTVKLGPSAGQAEWHHIHTYIHIHTFIHTLHTYIHTYIHTYVRTYVRTYEPAYIRTYVHTYIRTYIHAYIYYIHTFIHTCIHTFIQAYIHEYIHAYIRTYEQMYILTYVHTCIPATQRCQLHHRPSRRAGVVLCTRSFARRESTDCLVQHGSAPQKNEQAKTPKHVKAPAKKNR